MWGAGRGKERCGEVCWVCEKVRDVRRGVEDAVEREPMVRFRRHMGSGTYGAL